MRSKSDPISMLKDRMLSNNMASVEELKVRLHKLTRTQSLRQSQLCLSVNESVTLMVKMGITQLY